MPGDAPVSVIKIGGSVLSDRAAYRRAAAFVASRLCELAGERFVVVVSAEQGQTDALLAHSRELCPDPDHAALDLLWSTGELRSVALLALALHALGVRAVGVNVHQTGIVADGRAASFRFRPLRLRAVLDRTDVVVAPGFLARLAGDAVASLGRGGSDLTAVLLAAGLRARRCELIKDVPGYFSADPNLHRDATHLPAVSWDEALRLAEGGCELVQAAAIQEARTHALPLVVRGLGGDGRTTVVAARPSAGCRHSLAAAPDRAAGDHFPEQGRGETSAPPGSGRDQPGAVVVVESVVASPVVSPGFASLIQVYMKATSP